MKKLFLFFLLSFLFNQNMYSYFSASRIGGYENWSRTQILKFESKLELYGIFYESTINLKLKLGENKQYDSGSHYTCTSPPSGQYEFVWTFTLPKDSHIKDLQVWNNSTNSFMPALPISLTKGEANYQSTKNSKSSVLLRQFMRRDYSGNYSLQYELRISPVNYNEPAEFILRFISPAKMYFNKRVISEYSSQFYTRNDYDKCYTDVDALHSVIDYNNPDVVPQLFNRTPLPSFKNEGFWRSYLAYGTDYQYSFPEELNVGKFLRTSSNSDLKFFQLTTKPFIANEERLARKIVLCFDLVQNGYSGYNSKDAFFDDLINAITISTTDKDSLIFLTNDFSIKWYSTSFEKRSEALISEKLNDISYKTPKVNLLPYMLKDIVQYLNNKNADAEVWIISDDYKTAVRPETVMDLLSQTYYAAKTRVKFKIVDATYGYYSSYIQNKYYRGNEYLYENLTRISGGNFQKLYNYSYAAYLDAMLDCWAPIVSTVEIDPVVSGGFTYSRQNLNEGRNNFNITQRYFQYGVYSGSLPMTVNYFGNFLGSSYKKTIQLAEDKTNLPVAIQKNTELYWYGNYIINDLFLQPQSYSTIKYIEDLSVKEQLLTPYTAFVIPSASGYIGFKRIYEDEIVVSVKDNEQESIDAKKNELTFESYPNPFNPTTNITIHLSSNLLNANKVLEIYDILGRRIKSFNMNEFQNSSLIKVSWNGDNDLSQQVSSGIYLAVFRSGGIVKSIKLQLVR